MPALPALPSLPARSQGEEISVFFYFFEFSFIFSIASVLAFIHAFFPDTFITSTSDTNKQIEKILKESGCTGEDKTD